MIDSDFYDNGSLEATVKQQFGLGAKIAQIVVDRVAVGGLVSATVFLTDKKQLYCYIDGRSRLNLGDIRKIISRMGLRASQYMPPRGKPQYFDDVGREKFVQVFPGRHEIGAQDLMFYRTLAPYVPALVQIQEVADGVIYQADSDARSGWRPAVRFSYRRADVS